MMKDFGQLGQVIRFDGKKEDYKPQRHTEIFANLDKKPRDSWQELLSVSAASRG